MNKPKIVFIYWNRENDLLIDEDMNFYRLEKIDGGMTGDFITNSTPYYIQGD